VDEETKFVPVTVSVKFGAARTAVAGLREVIDGTGFEVGAELVPPLLEADEPPPQAAQNPNDTTQQTNVPIRRTESSRL